MPARVRTVAAAPKSDALEPKVMLAGTVAFDLVGDTLQVTGDGEDNQAAVVIAGNTATLFAAGGTTLTVGGIVVPSGTPVPIPAEVANLDVDLDGGDDVFLFDGGNAFLPGNATFNLGAGNDLGIVGNLTVGGTQRHDTGETSDAVDALALINFSSGGDARVDGDAAVNFLGVVGGVYQQDLTVWGSTGTDFVGVLGSQVGDDLRIRTRGGTDFAGIGAVVANDKLVVDTGAGSDLGFSIDRIGAIPIGPAFTGDDFDFELEGGNDFFFGQGTHNVGDDYELNGGSGTDFFIADEPNVADNTRVRRFEGGGFSPFKLNEGSPFEGIEDVDFEGLLDLIDPLDFTNPGAGSDGIAEVLDLFVAGLDSSEFLDFGDDASAESLASLALGSGFFPEFVAEPIDPVDPPLPPPPVEVVVEDTVDNDLSDYTLPGNSVDLNGDAIGADVFADIVGYVGVNGAVDASDSYFINAFGAPGTLDVEVTNADVDLNVALVTNVDGVRNFVSSFNILAGDEGGTVFNLGGVVDYELVVLPLNLPAAQDDGPITYELDVVIDFDGNDPPPLFDDVANDLSEFSVPGISAAPEFNDDGVASTSGFVGDFASDGIIDAADYLEWQRNIEGPDTIIPFAGGAGDIDLGVTVDRAEIDLRVAVLGVDEDGQRTFISSFIAAAGSAGVGNDYTLAEADGFVGVAVVVLPLDLLNSQTDALTTYELTLETDSDLIPVA